MSHLPTTLVGVLSILLAFIFYLASADIPKRLSPQGCQMSWMSPSYILQSGLNTSWSPLADRYSVWLYREVGWEGTPVNGQPVLFIPGNAGSSHQVRSIASSAARQFYQSPYVVSDEFSGRKIKPLDFYAVEFNEDLSAFHGPTLASQISYSSRAISYILSHYSPNTTIIVMGHSMGGVVATSLLPSPDISAIITMSTPHTLPPARFDARIDKIYARNQQILLNDSTPILSLCGGATDLMIASESCILPDVPNNATETIFRRTVFTSALEGSWTGVGHREMVWCHQVRWRVARAALELGGSSSIKDRANILDRWLRDGNRLPSATAVLQHDLSLLDRTTYEILPANSPLVLNRPSATGSFLLPIPSHPSKFTLFVLQGSIPPVSPHISGSLRVSVHLCRGRASPESSAVNGSQLPSSCGILPPVILKLIPNPIPGKPFPVPDEGSSESEGVVVFEADIQPSHSEYAWVAVHVEGATGLGQVIGGFTSSRHNDAVVTSDSRALVPFFGKVSIKLPVSDQTIALRREIQIPNLLSNALVTYRLTPKSHLAASQSEYACRESLLPPIIMYTSHPSESHYFPLMHSPLHPLILHTHTSAPYIPDVHSTQSRGLHLVIYSSASPDCIIGLDLQVDWWSTLGRLGSRYTMTVLSWAVGVVALVLFGAWEVNDRGTPTLSVQQSLTLFISNRFTKLLVGSYIVACLPFPASYYLGIKGEPILAPIAPLILFIVTGLVCVSWWFLIVLIWPLSRMGRLLTWSRRNANSGSKSAIVSMCLIFMLIFLFVPWQVAFLGCWTIHLYSCARSPSRPTAVDPSAAIPLISQTRSDGDDDIQPRLDTRSHPASSTYTQLGSLSQHHRNMHILLLMTWLLPLVAPVLAVWVRTLLTTRFTVPFDGDHNFLNVAPFLLLVDSFSSNGVPEANRRTHQIIRWSFFVLGLFSIFIGPRTVHRVFDTANLVVALMVILTRSHILGISIPRLTTPGAR